MSYTPFKQMERKLAGRPGVTNPAGLAAHIAATKYGRRQLQQHAAAGTSMRNTPRKRRPASRHRPALERFARSHRGY